VSVAIFGTRIVGESLTRKFDFASQLAVGETLSGPSATATVYSGVDATPTAIVSTVSASGSIVSVLEIGGVAGTIYTLVASVGTSLGNTLKMQGFSAVVSAGY
jgi:hypothetical protein